MSAIYDHIGDNYSQTRRADERIVERLVQLLGLSRGSRVLDIGAGTGRYSLALAEKGFEITALEPSKVMAHQAPQHQQVSWVAGSAEDLPFDSESFDGAILILCIHHFSNLEQGLREARRAVGTGPVVIFTYDPRALEKPWLFDYFPVFRAQIQDSFPAMERLASFLAPQSEVSTYPFPLPHDLKDSFAGAAWRYPERYLDQEFRDGTSAFRQLDAGLAEAGLQQLRKDLESNTWDQKYGEIRSFTEYDHGYTFVLSHGTSGLL